MANENQNDKDLENTHHFHERYRASGIALCISLAALATSESWWFYRFLNDILQSENCLQQIFYLLVMVSAVIVIFLSFYFFEFLHKWI